MRIAIISNVEDKIFNFLKQLLSFILGFEH